MSVSPSSIVVVGSANVDLTVRTPRLPRPGETVTAGPVQLLPGGKSSNQAAAAALLGGRVSLIAAVGEDANGQFILDNLAACGVDTDGIRRVPGPSGTALIAVDDHGENFILVSPGANAHLTPDDVAARAETIAAAQVMGLSFEVPLAINREAARTAHARGVKVVLNPSPFITPPPDLLADVDILVVNEHEFTQLVPDAPAGTPWHRCLPFLEDLPVRQLVITLGGQGAVVIDRGHAGQDRAQVLEIPPVKVEAVDTTGCGDAFMGALLHGLASGLPLSQSAVRATAVGAFAATGVGAQTSYPSAARLEEFLEDRGAHL